MKRHPRTYDLAIANSEGRAIRLWQDHSGNYRINRKPVKKEVVHEWLSLTRFPHRKQQASDKTIWLMFKDREALILFKMTFQ